MAESRSSPRKRTLLGGRIEFKNRSFTVECVVKDISETGARLLLTGTTEIPAEFDLWIPERNQRYRAQVVWRKASLVGVRFI